MRSVAVPPIFRAAAKRSAQKISALSGLLQIKAFRQGLPLR